MAQGMTGSPDGAEQASAGGARVYRCGSLTYTGKGLAFLFAWLLWGDVCFQLMETIIPSILPLKLQSLGSSNVVLGLIMTTLPGVFNTTVCPWVSFKSDRYRSRWGRRLPFILATLPFLTAALLLIAFADPIAAWLHGALFQGASCTRAMVAIGCLALFAGLFDLFNMFVNSVFWYLFNDVVPHHHLARFMAYFRLVATLTSAFYNFFLFRYALSHMREIYLGVAVLYFLGFGLMCLKVKEGEYPPPEDAGQRPSLRRDIRVFAKECFTIPFYWDMFLYTMFTAIGGCMWIYAVFFDRSLGLSLDQIGNLRAATLIAVACCLLFAGSLVDRWHPVRMVLYASIWGAVTGFNNLIWLVADTPSASLLFWVLLCGMFAWAPFSAVSQSAAAPREMLLFPQDRYGQFCGAQALVRSVGTMAGGAIAGLFLDIVRRDYGNGSLFPYRYIYFWIGLFTCLAAICNYRVYRAWKRLGAEEAYRPPTGRFRFADLPPALHAPPAPKGPLVLFGVMFLGNLIVDAFWVWHFRFVARNEANVILFAAMLGVLCVEFWLFLRLVRLAARP
jgi:maltose/moltooligosaccharide transporter